MSAKTVSPHLVKCNDDNKTLPGGGTDIDISSADPDICNLYLAIAHILAAEVFDKYLDDDSGDNGWWCPIYFGSPFVSDDVLMCRLKVLAS